MNRFEMIACSNIRRVWGTESSAPDDAVFNPWHGHWQESDASFRGRILQELEYTQWECTLDEIAGNR